MTEFMKNVVFKNNTKYNQMIEINNKLNIKTSSTNKLVFVYSVPKVGSTTIVSSLRIFAAEKIDIIHVHDETMLEILGNINNTTVNEIIQFNQYIGRNVFVIDVYRNPIERKMSTFFEKIGSYHFNNVDDKINNYDVNAVINRFNRIFPHIGNGDHFMDKYMINIPKEFDYKKKYLLIQENGIKYLKLRLNDVNLWGKILTDTLQHNIMIVKDYETNNKAISNLYHKFKQQYKIPINYLEILKTDKYFNYYNSDTEIASYISEWDKKSCNKIKAYTQSQYDVYNEITMENSHLDYIQSQHYIDDGCKCNLCNIKRLNIRNKIIRGGQITEKIYHNDKKNKIILKALLEQKYPRKIKQTAKNFTTEMKQIVYKIK